MAEPETNLARIEHWAALAHDAGATFAVFPEECVTGR
jgi:predicted amidohydrolase